MNCALQRTCCVTVHRKNSPRHGARLTPYFDPQAAAALLETILAVNQRLHWLAVFQERRSTAAREKRLNCRLHVTSLLQRGRFARPFMMKCCHWVCPLSEIVCSRSSRAFKTQLCEHAGGAPK